MIYVKDLNGNEFELPIKIPKIAPGAILDLEKETEIIKTTTEYEINLEFKTITKKRFIKLLMSKGYQRNQAAEMHKEYMKTSEVRTKIGLEMFILFHKHINLFNNKVSINGKFVEGDDKNE